MAQILGKKTPTPDDNWQERKYGFDQNDLKLKKINSFFSSFFFFTILEQYWKQKKNGNEKKKTNQKI